VKWTVRRQIEDRRTFYVPLITSARQAGHPTSISRSSHRSVPLAAAPSIFKRFPNAVEVKAVCCAQAFANYRTVKLDTELAFPDRIKLSLACCMTSALRTITPWTACAGSQILDLLSKLVPEDLWVFREVTAVVGSQYDIEESKHQGGVLLEHLEIRARERGEALIVAAALVQKSMSGEWICHAVGIFGLDTVEKKKLWVKKCVSPKPSPCHIQWNC
jgi:hypothetical protein